MSSAADVLGTLREDDNNNNNNNNNNKDKFMVGKIVF